MAPERIDRAPMFVAVPRALMRAPLCGSSWHQTMDSTSDRALRGFCGQFLVAG